MWLIFLISIVLVLISCQSRNDKSHPLNFGDNHTHLTTYGENAIDSLNKYGITIVRDCMGDLTLLKQWRDEIEIIEEAGLTKKEAIEAATINLQKCLGIKDSR